MQTKTIATILLVAIAAIGIQMATESAQAQSSGNPHIPGAPTGNPHPYPSCSGDPHGQPLGGFGGTQCPGPK